MSEPVYKFIADHSEGIKYAFVGALMRAGKMGLNAGKALWKRKGLAIGGGLTALDLGTSAAGASSAAGDAYRAANAAAQGSRMMGNTF